jgi:hypothetical protein
MALKTATKAATRKAEPSSSSEKPGTIAAATHTEAAATIQATSRRMRLIRGLVGCQPASWP